MDVKFYVLAFAINCAVFLNQNICVVGNQTYEEDILVEEEEQTGKDILSSTEEVEKAQGQLTGSPNADVLLHFTVPAIQPEKPVGLPAGKIVEFLVNFHNKDNQDFILHFMETSLRYPFDYTYTLQNFSALYYRKTVNPDHQTTLIYSFVPSDLFVSRSLGLTILLAYQNAAGRQFMEAVYNNTVNIIDTDESIDVETIFLYIFLGALIVLLLIAGYHLFSSYFKRQSVSTSKSQVEIGTSNPNEVDYDWLPADTMRSWIKSRGNISQKQSPKQSRFTHISEKSKKIK